MKIARVVVVGALLLGAIGVGCGKKSDDSSGAAGGADAPASATAPATTAATPPPVTTPTVPVNHDADSNAIRGCCAALRSSGTGKPPADKAKSDAAASACDGMVALVKNGATPRSGALASIRAALHGQPLPPGCN